VKCQYCGKEEALPFKCQYCQGLFCSEHRLPENHACPMADKARAPREEAPFEYKVTYTPPRSAMFGFSSTEIRHLTISALLVMGVGLTWIFFLQELSPEMLVGSALIFTSIFLLHEIAHKFVAQHYGMWAEFRLTMFGAIITLLSIISPFKIISPGAVMIAGSANKRVMGITAIAGPLTNITLSVIFFGISNLLPKDSLLFPVAVFSAALSSFIAVFNLIPIGILDGLKVFGWNKIIWGAAFTSSLALIVAIFAFNPWLLY
jgi:Zn-dependent protease